MELSLRNGRDKERNTNIMPKKYRACQYAILKKLDQNSENPKYCTSIIIAAKQDFTLRHQCRGVIADTGSKKIT